MNARPFIMLFLLALIIANVNDKCTGDQHTEAHNRIETNQTKIQNELINLQQDIAAIGQDSVHSTE